jgi:hypothetical protein
MTDTIPVAAESSTPDCRGKTSISDHHMVVVGNCTHHPKGSIRDYEASRCRDCGVTAHRPRMFACDPKIKAVAATVETCAVLAAARPATAAGDER